MEFYTCDKTEQPKFDDKTCFLFFENGVESDRFVDDNYDEITQYRDGWALIKALHDHYGGWFFYDEDKYGNGVFRHVPTELFELIAK